MNIASSLWAELAPQIGRSLQSTVPFGHFILSLFSAQFPGIVLGVWSRKESRLGAWVAPQQLFCPAASLCCGVRVKARGGVHPQGPEVGPGVGGRDAASFSRI